MRDESDVCGAGCSAAAAVHVEAVVEAATQHQASGSHRLPIS